MIRHNLKFIKKLFREMKQLFLLVITIAMLTVQSRAQDIRMGLVGGMNFATFSTELFDGQFRIAGHGGIYAERELSGNWMIHAELLYSQQGVTLRDGEAKIMQNNDYLSFPMLMKWSDAGKMELLFGPSINILLRSRELLEYPGYFAEDDTRDAYYLIDIGLQIGFQYPINDKLSAGVRYYMGVMETSKLYNYINAHFSIPLLYKF